MKKGNYGRRNFRFRYYRIHKSVTRNEYYKIIFIITKFAIVNSSNTSKILHGFHHVLHLPT